MATKRFTSPSFKSSFFTNGLSRRKRHEVQKGNSNLKAVARQADYSHNQEGKGTPLERGLERSHLQRYDLSGIRRCAFCPPLLNSIAGQGKQVFGSFGFAALDGLRGVQDRPSTGQNYSALQMIWQDVTWKFEPQMGYYRC
jgi:hypothetical protein